jgi:1,4-alpha-glucan branching enzyme
MSTTATPPLDPADVSRLQSGSHDDPFAVLGPHRRGDRTWVTVFDPGAEEMAALVDRKEFPLGRVEGGLFSGEVPADKPYALRGRGGGRTWDYEDAYRFGPVLSDLDEYLLGEGTHQRLWEALGAHPRTLDGVAGTHFAVWAPNARRVSVVGDFNAWDGRRHVMRRRGATGVWEIFVPGARDRAAYKYEIVGAHGERLPLKADPVGFGSQHPPETASIVRDIAGYGWSDQDWMETRALRHRRDAPISIYEVHLGSWKRLWNQGGRPLSYKEAARELVGYVRDMGFTHLEFLPLSEYPFDGSWGYQPIGLYAPSIRFGPPHEFRDLVEAAHQAGLGVLLDWVPGHFPTTRTGLRASTAPRSTSTRTPRQGFHQDWNTAIYNFGRREVFAYLINNALYWSEKFTSTGCVWMRWRPCCISTTRARKASGCPTSTGAARTWRRSPSAGDEPGRLRQPPGRDHAGGGEHVLSGGERAGPCGRPGLRVQVEHGLDARHAAVHGARADPPPAPPQRAHLRAALRVQRELRAAAQPRRGGARQGLADRQDAGRRLAEVREPRAYYGFMWGYPGKKLLFMGQEFAQGAEWSEARELDWGQLDIPAHEGVRALVRDLNRLYRERPALHAGDCEGDGFEWLIADDAENSVYAWLRKAPGANPVAVVSNFTPVPREGYRAPLPAAGRWRESSTPTPALYGGSGMGNLGRVEAREDSAGVGAVLTLPPLATVWLEYEPAS